mgnify:CR=1 FL=1
MRRTQGVKQNQVHSVTAITEPRNQNTQKPGTSPKFSKIWRKMVRKIESLYSKYNAKIDIGSKS